MRASHPVLSGGLDTWIELGDKGGTSAGVLAGNGDLSPFPLVEVPGEVLGNHENQRIKTFFKPSLRGTI